MEQLTFDDANAGHVVLNHTPISLTFTLPEEGEVVHESRLFIPVSIQDKSPFDLASEFLAEAAGNAESEAEREELSNVFSLTWLNNYNHGADKRWTRRFNARTFRHSGTLRGLIKDTRTQGQPVFKQLIAMAGDISEPDEVLLSRAIYEEPVIRLPYDEDQYQAFRKQYLGEVRSVTEQIQRLGIRAIRQELKEAKRRGESKTVVAARKMIRRIENGDMPKAICKVVRQFARNTYREISQKENEHKRFFGGLIRKLDGLISEVNASLERHGIQGPCVACKNIIRAEFGPRVDRLLTAFIKRFRRVYDFSDLHAVPLQDSPVPEIPGNPSSRVEEDYYCALLYARGARDCREKLTILHDLRNQLVSRTECARRVQREAEAVHHRMLSVPHEIFFRTARKHMDRLERRMFRLMWLPQPCFGGRIAMLSPVISSFIFDMDQGTQALTFLSLVAAPREKVLKEELGRRWRAYLKLYPFWVRAVRDDEREASRQRSATKTTSLHKSGTSQDGNRSELGDVLPDRKAVQPHNDPTLLALFKEDLFSLVQKYCDQKQAETIVAYFRNGQSQEQIAADKGVTQQAVSKWLRDGVAKLRRGLLDDKPLKLDEK